MARGIFHGRLKALAGATMAPSIVHDSRMGLCAGEGCIGGYYHGIPPWCMIAGLASKER